MSKELDMSQNNDGFVVGYQDVDKLVKMNKLPEVTNPVYITINKSSRVPTPDGVLSYEIFGVGEDRKHKMAYIDLHIHYMNPNAAAKLSTFYKPAHDCLYAKGRFKLVDGELVEDEAGETGGEFLYKVWDKLKFKKRSTIITKEIEDAFKSISKEILFVTKCPVIPAAYRDINTTDSSRISTNMMNDWYSKLISYSRDIKSNRDGFGIMTAMTSASVQTILDEIYRYTIVDKIKGVPAKYGFFKRYIVAKNIGNTSRSVVTAPDLNVESMDRMLVRYGKTGIPLAQVVGLFFPFMSKWIKDWLENELSAQGRVAVKEKDGSTTYKHIKNPFDDTFIHDMLHKFLKSPELRIEKIKFMVDGKMQGLMHKGRWKKSNNPLNRPMTWLDLVYIAAEDVVASKHADITRFPVTSENSQYAAKIAVLSTRETVPVIIGQTLYPFYPVIEEGVDPSNMFLDSVQASNAYTSQQGLDYDGDQTSQMSRFTDEANKEADEQINSKLYYLSVSGKWMRPLSNEFILTAYSLTHKTPKSDINDKQPLYKL